jgi:hypothetical protein
MIGCITLQCLVVVWLYYRNFVQLPDLYNIFGTQLLFFPTMVQLSQTKKSCQDEAREADAGQCTSAKGGYAADPTTCKGSDQG